ncbi:MULTISPECIES: DUF2484 family protein [unclassified Ruegeria]|uniref:DUF2484 family protein n=1 Tax=unclassified Ruegeria TaxID=2625375 RepID=UPI001ADAB5E5|nr:MULTISPECIES: DUF2484 family protein [unclassified Ruegeria]MBO9411289.1 DUF2484 family protein [Ruegeria sp. R8_1]MBO9415490.1 DUF2484 family protein [Ruegeria sp. R8_2]
MVNSVVFAGLWVIASTIVAMLPMRLQFPPGVVLFVCAPALIVWLGHDFGWVVSVLAFAGFASMFRNPIRHYWRRWTGQEVQE